MKKKTQIRRQTRHTSTWSSSRTQIQACVICFISVVWWDVTVGRLLLLCGWMMRFVQNGQKGKNNKKIKKQYTDFNPGLCFFPSGCRGQVIKTIRPEKNQYDIQFLSARSDTFSAAWRQPEIESNHGGAHNKNTWQTKLSVSCQVLLLKVCVCLCVCILLHC